MSVLTSVMSGFVEIGHVTKSSGAKVALKDISFFSLIRVDSDLRDGAFPTMRGRFCSSPLVGSPLVAA